jgi:hypothetical protein
VRLAEGPSSVEGRLPLEAVLEPGCQAEQFGGLRMDLHRQLKSRVTPLDWKGWMMEISQDSSMWMIAIRVYYDHTDGEVEQSSKEGAHGTLAKECYAGLVVAKQLQTQDNLDLNPPAKLREMCHKEDAQAQNFPVARQKVLPYLAAASGSTELQPSGKIAPTRQVVHFLHHSKKSLLMKRELKAFGVPNERPRHEALPLCERGHVCPLQGCQVHRQCPEC